MRNVRRKRCTLCAGKGWHTCFACDGFGITTLPLEKGQTDLAMGAPGESCPKCGGSGIVYCSCRNDDDPQPVIWEKNI